MIVHVLAREVREYSRSKVAAPKPVHRQCVRACFEYRVAAPGFTRLGQKSLQVHRFRRGVRGRIIPRRCVIRDRAEQTRLLAGSPDHRIDYRCGGGLAVGSRHRDHLKCCRGVFEEICGCNRECLPRFSNTNPCDVRWKLFRWIVFTCNRGRALRYRVEHECVPIHLCAVQRKK